MGYTRVDLKSFRRLSIIRGISYGQEGGGQGCNKEESEEGEPFTVVVGRNPSPVFGTSVLTEEKVKSGTFRFRTTEIECLYKYIRKEYGTEYGGRVGRT